MHYQYIHIHTITVTIFQQVTIPVLLRNRYKTDLVVHTAVYSAHGCPLCAHLCETDLPVFCFVTVS